MSYKFKYVISYLLMLSLLVSFAPSSALAAEDSAGYEVTLLEVGEEDEFGDSPAVTFDGEESFSNAEIAGQSSDAITDVTEKISSMSAATESEAEEENPISIEGDDVAIDGDEESEVSLLAATSISFSTPNLCISKGGTTTIYITVSNFTGTVNISGNVTNGNVCAGRFGKVNGSTIALIVTGKNVGDCAFNLYVTKNGNTLASKRLEVSVLTAARPQITVSSSSLNIAKNSRAAVTVSHNQRGANVYVGWEWSNNGVVSCGWGGWNSTKTSFPFYVDGKSSGSATIKLGLYNRFDQLLAYTYISPAKVYEVSNPSLTLSSTSVSMYTGNTSRVRVTVSGMSGSWYLNVSYPKVCTARWQKVSSNVYDLYIGGNTPVSRSATIELRDSNDRVVKSANLSINIVSRASPKITVSKSSVNVAAGSRAVVNISVSDCNEAAYLHPVRSSSAFGITWGNWSGNTVPCTVLGYSSYSLPVTATLTVQLCRQSDNRVLDTKTISIRITAASRPPMAYSFTNYSRPNIPLSTCQIIFGNGQRAKTVFNRDYGNGGVCFGMSTSSALIYHGSGGLNLRNFNGSPSSIYNLSLNSSNSSVGYNLRQIVEAMHVSQYSSRYSKTTGVGAVANKIVSELNQGRLITVGVRGDYNGQKNCGHRVLAYGYSYPSSQELLVKIYDPNSTNMATLSFTRSSSSGNYTSWYFSNFDWGTGKPNASINCIALDSISYIWNNRGSWILQLFGEGSLEPEQEHLNLLATSEKSFELFAYDAENPSSDGTLVLKCENGEVKYIDDDVIHVESWGILPDGTAEKHDLLFYLPIDYYTFKDLSLEDGVEAVLSDDAYSVTVSTDAHQFDFYAEDSTKTVGALISASEGDVYQVSIGSSVEGEPDNYSYSGTGVDGMVSIALENGELTADGIASASVSITTDEPVQYYSIYDNHTTGGSVVYADERSTDLAKGDSCLVQFVPNDGYQVYNVNIDGTDYGCIDSYTFSDISNNHQIYADFRRNIAECRVTFLGYNDENEPVFTLTNSDGGELVTYEEYSYSWLAEESGSIAFFASEDSAYTGVLIYTMDETQKMIISSSIDENQVVNVKLSTTVLSSKVIAALFDENERMFAVQTKDVNSNELSLDFSYANLPSVYHVSVFWVDETIKPICEKFVF